MLICVARVPKIQVIYNVLCYFYITSERRGKHAINTNLRRPRWSRGKQWHVDQKEKRKSKRERGRKIKEDEQQLAASATPPSAFCIYVPTRPLWTFNLFTGPRICFPQFTLSSF